MGIPGYILNYLRGSRYCIGFIVDYKSFEPVDYNRIHWLDLSSYKDGWFADPFILSADPQTIIVLAEEWYYPINHGRISRLKISRDEFRLLEVKPILQLETHLSFPYIFRENDIVYICPENEESGCVKIYEYDTVSDRLTRPVGLVNKPLMDVQIFKSDGQYFLTGVEYSTGEQTDTRILQVYTADNLLGPYRLNQVIESEYCDKRGAGLIFEYNGKAIRPSQCCDNNEYGTAVIFNEMEIKNGVLTEREIGRICRDKRRHNGIVLHTFNQLDNLTAIDGWDYTHRYIGRTVEYLRKKYRKYVN